MKHVDVSAPDVMRHPQAPNLPSGDSLSAFPAFPLPDSREAIEALVESLIAVLDMVDGDADLENATDAEDDFTLTSMALQYTDGPGCAVSDPPGLEGTEDDGWLSPQAAQYADRGPGCRISDPDDERI